MKTNKNVVITKDSHSRTSLSGIFHARRYQTKCHPRASLSGISTLFSNHGFTAHSVTPTLRAATYAGYSGHHGFTPRRHPELDSGSCRFAKAFTLIELLVVVLIIGILAAVALPQYQLAVVKARVSTILPIVKSMASANEMYYLEHGTYASREASETLDIDMPKGCVRQYQHNYWQCDTDYGIDFSNQVRIILHYCPNHNANYDTCTTSAEFALDKFYNHADTSSVASDVPGKWLCRPKTALGTKICSSLNLNYH